MQLILEGLRRTSARKMSENEIPAEKLAAFLDGRLDAEERAAIEARLAADPLARAEVIAAGRLVAEVETNVRQRRFPWTQAMLGAAAAAAVLTIVLVPGSRAWRGQPAVVSERVGETETGGRIVLLTPVEDAPVGVDPVRFSWRAAENATYRITLTDAAGATLWSATTDSAAIVLPDTVRLPPRSRFFWYVDAMLLDGSSFTSGPRAFSTGDR